MKVWTTLSESELYDVANEVGVAIAVGQTSTEDWYSARYETGGNTVVRVEIPKIGRAYSFGLRPLRALGKSTSGDYLYQRTSASGFHADRRVFAVCWHGHRDFMRAIYKRDQNARIKSYIADYRNAQDFEEKFPATGHENVGSMMYPMQAREVCNCWKEEWHVNLSDRSEVSVYNMKQSDIQACPFYIMVPEHYRPDGSCKCNDPAEQERMIRGWGYTREDFKS